MTRSIKDPSTADGPAMSPAAMDAFLARPLIARLATSHHDRPRVLPMWFLWDGTALWMETSPTFANARILRSNPNAAVTVDESLGGFRLRAVVMRGSVELIKAPHERVMEMVRGIYARYLSPDEQASAAGKAMLATGHLLIRFTPDRIISWDTSRADG
jgi:nitroimidazol reductase NimA-like FMN-containing flavoprotein (pyridoxamine 5'-phosphate oxidase superfamily)